MTFRTRANLLCGATALCVAAVGLAACSYEAPTAPLGRSEDPASTSASRATTASDGVWAASSGEHFNEKFEFTPVTFPDGAEGTIRAASKKNKNSRFTNCSYFDLAETFLGSFGSDSFASDEPGSLEQFCLDHYGDRTD